MPDGHTKYSRPARAHDNRRSWLLLRHLRPTDLRLETPALCAQGLDVLEKKPFLFELAIGTAFFCGLDAALVERERLVHARPE